MIGLYDLSGQLALDARSLDALRLQAQRDPKQALGAAARQFEALFLQQMLKSMRDATPQNGLLDNNQTRLYTSMLDQQLAQTLSSRGIGLADMMIRQLSGSTAGIPAATQPPGAGAQAASTGAKAVSGGTPAAASAAGATPSSPAAPGSREEFLQRMKKHAVQASTATGIPARFLLGQAALESGWGRHEIRSADGSPSYNVFGIKAGAGWKGATVEAMTTEYINGVARTVPQKFRAYGSYAEAFQDYAALMRGNPRYAEVLRQTDAAGFARSLQRAGYATDPQYAAKLTSILNSALMQRTLAA